ncbi:MAG: hypothetical protein ACLGIM_21475, partial [Alphaproteobacteria bacterium]
VTSPSSSYICSVFTQAGPFAAIQSANGDHLKADVARMCYGNRKSTLEALVDFPKGHTNLYLIEIGEPQNRLRIVVAEGVLGRPSPITFDDIDLGEGRPIEITDQSRRFELIWDSYVAYVVRNESYWLAEPNQIPIKDQLERRFKSAFLDFLSKTTFADDEYPGPLQHWALSTLNHCVDVVSVQPPHIKLLETASS